MPAEERERLEAQEAEAKAHEDAKRAMLKKGMGTYAGVRKGKGKGKGVLGGRGKKRRATGNVARKREVPLSLDA